MADLGLDYAFARPTGTQLKAAGVHGVGRYLADDARALTAAEYADLKANGIGLWLAYEEQSADLSVSMLNGYQKGVQDANNALRIANSLGLPSNVVVHWAADFDIAPGSDRVAPAEAYVDGWNTVFPAGRRAGYGGLWFLNYLHGRGKVDRLWECASTSFRHGVDPASVPLDLQQTTLTPPIASTDHNNIFTTASMVGATQEDELANADEVLAAVQALASQLNSFGSELNDVKATVKALTPDLIMQSPIGETDNKSGLKGNSVSAVLADIDANARAAVAAASKPATVTANAATLAAFESAATAAISKLNLSIDATALIKAFVQGVNVTLEAK